MKYLLVTIMSFMMMNASGQKQVELEELKNNIGETVEVRGKVAAMTSGGKGKSSYTIISVGEKSPKEQLLILVKPKLGFNFNDKKISSCAVVVTGRVELYQGKPRIVIRDHLQLKFFYDEEVDTSDTPSIDNN